MHGEYNLIFILNGVEKPIYNWGASLVHIIFVTVYTHSLCPSKGALLVAVDCAPLCAHDFWSTLFVRGLEKRDSIRNDV